MKKFIPICIAIAFLSCKTEKKTEKVTDSLSNQIALNRLDSAKLLLDYANSTVASGITHKMAPEKVTMKVRQIMASYKALYKTLPPADTLELFNYRIKKIQELVELQKKQSK
ncbi:hypothetical protein ACJVDH_02030 [Pedobacter sp. AW1-32]|uniref:hypothetical protein n=1 Tax=Pedobacter sp. AW1-32 TaxID=3383026 RepID=UPI003FEF38E9